MIRIAAVLLLLLPVATISCTTKAKSDTPNAKSDQGADLLVQLETKEAADVAKTAALALLLPGPRMALNCLTVVASTPKDDMRKEPCPSGTSLTWTPVHVEMAAAAMSATRTGTGCTRLKIKEGKTAVSYGKFTTIWKKQKDRQWKVAVNITNSSPAPQS
jgi:hypothetical protein